jgi:long-chain acyl-CoA synthetase
VIEFLENAFRISVFNAYGATEVQAIAINGVLVAFSSSTGDDYVGKITTGVQVRLTDVPELNYFSSDKPMPRGMMIVSFHFFHGFFFFCFVIISAN